MGLNFYYYDGLQPKMRAGIINEHECTWRTSTPQSPKYLLQFNTWFYCLPTYLVLVRGYLSLALHKPCFFLTLIQNSACLLGIYISGARVSHPFKVYEPEPDRRSVCSVSSSVHGRSSTTKSVQYEPNSRGDSVPKFVDVSYFMLLWIVLNHLLMQMPVDPNISRNYIIKPN